MISARLDNRIRKVSEAGRKFICSYEQFEPVAYRKVPGEPWTIGFGNTFYADGRPVKKGDTITIKEAEKLFDLILAKFEQEVDSLLQVNVSQSQFDMLVSFAYNVGSDIDDDTKAEGLGDSTLLKYVNADPNDPRIAIEFQKWNKSGGKVLKGLTRRRIDEGRIYFNLKPLYR